MKAPGSLLAVAPSVTRAIMGWLDTWTRDPSPIDGLVVLVYPSASRDEDEEAWPALMVDFRLRGHREVVPVSFDLEMVPSGQVGATVARLLNKARTQILCRAALGPAVADPIKN